MTIKFVTEGGKPNMHNVYYENWTCKINTDMDITGNKIVTWEDVQEAYEADHPEEPAEVE